MKKVMASLLFALLALFFSSCLTDSDEAWSAEKVCPDIGTNAYGMPNRGTFTDERDGRVYKYTTIGDQVWMAENLNYKTEAWSVCYFEEDGCNTVGRFYLYDSASCPLGWHLPSMDEWQILGKSVDGSGNAALHLKSVSGWIPLNPGDSANGYDDCGFNMQPSLAKRRDDGLYAYFLTSTLDSSIRTNDVPNHVWRAVFASQRTSLHFGSVLREGDVSNVRCVKD
ncbi:MULTISPECIES: FISUMP domain-containing protein [unclassified Fibrobacter]|uniref:FISUMP domain-containing protein n=1 Tax=unclassified Fibrobacter TaxID=2634177 RepID=UPI0009205A5C|nr:MULTISPECIES: FISUMP domain-containing protein [Fibrobacter]MCQ2099426.1 hypothetical protein [Fibrobacter sp.]MCL4100944.1 hypothetical protein [Fibrobacter succinogenes]MDO4946607.1 FISUMP domain-containing protein [Fibrobacter sp.]OWV06871.1 hypothetical protein B7993_03645 [Fibrobacter sp. UWH3]OWV16246.1 hypothetical protein B7992_03360 [Fibrobacter sp. UWH1]